jgi:ABC-type phosphate transport system permease subunit
MTLPTKPPQPETSQPAPPRGQGLGRRRRVRQIHGAATIAARGEPMVWLMGGALAICLAMIGGLLVLIVWQGYATFWPGPLIEVKTVDGKAYLGELTRSERYRPDASVFARLPEAHQDPAQAAVEKAGGHAHRRQLRTGNYRLTGTHFTWISDFEVTTESMPEWAVVIEQLEWGRFYGQPKSLQIDGQPAASTAAESWGLFNKHHAEIRDRWRQAREIETDDIGAANYEIESARLAVRGAELRHGKDSPEYRQAQAELARAEETGNARVEELRAEVTRLDAENNRYQLEIVTVDGQTEMFPLANIVRMYPANRLSWTDKLGVYVSRWWEYLADDPREANSEGGVFPAIIGTVVMTLIMSLAVVPFGVLAALYLKEYAKAGLIVSAVRIAVNNLAGVPSIVFGVFGLGFFCYIAGAYIDGGPKNAGLAPWPAPTWFLSVGALAALATGGFVLGLWGLSGRAAETTPRKRFCRMVSVVLWLGAVACLVLVLAKTPYFGGFFPEKVADGNPTYGKGGVMWGALTLALLTLPVVIVSTEEALAAVPNSMREGSYACGASKFQTIRRIVLPRAMPGIMTGMILAMARGAGEVAPLMLVGAVKLVKELPIDAAAPFVHPDRSFMHLGFHIYDLGFQSQNSEAAKPMVYTTTLLLILVVFVLNVAAVWLRGRLRRKFQGAQF